MLENYDADKNGLMYQVKRTPFVYDVAYAEAYDKLGELNAEMSYLRMGWVKGTIPGPIDTIIDIGYGNGAFLEVCLDSVKSCFGSDISGYPVPTGVRFVKNWISQKFDVATFFDVIEHFPDPYILKDCKAQYIVASVPWCHNHSEEWFRDWKHRKPNEHLWFFNDWTIYSFATAIGYEVIQKGNPEDAIRGHVFDEPNILTFTMRKL